MDSYFEALQEYEKISENRNLFLAGIWAEVDGVSGGGVDVVGGSIDWRSDTS